MTTVVTRAAIRDTLNPVQSARAFSLMVLCDGCCTDFGTKFGCINLKSSRLAWHILVFGKFWGAKFIINQMLLKETLKPENRNTRPMSESFGQYFGLIKDRTFMLPAVASGLLQGAFLFICQFQVSCLW